MAKLGRPKTSLDVEVQCLQCGLKRLTPEWQTAGRSYCSLACYWESRHGKPAPWLQVDPEDRTCGNCGKVFLVGGAGNRKRPSLYCSRNCANIASGHHRPERQLDGYEATWLAGLFDGEGSVIFPKGRPSSVRITISNTNLDLLNRVEEVTGTGRIIIASRVANNPKHKQAYWWQSYGNQARSLLRQMLPWLIVKREKALRALGEQQI